MSQRHNHNNPNDLIDNTNHNRRLNASGNNSRAHQGRNLRNTKDLIDKRLKQYPNQSFYRNGTELHCHACQKKVSPDSTSIKRHLGLDKKQAGNSNKGMFN